MEYNYQQDQQQQQQQQMQQVQKSPIICHDIGNRFKLTFKKTDLSIDIEMKDIVKFQIYHGLIDASSIGSVTNNLFSDIYELWIGIEEAVMCKDDSIKFEIDEGNNVRYIEKINKPKVRLLTFIIKMNLIEHQPGSKPNDQIDFLQNHVSDLQNVICQFQHENQSLSKRVKICEDRLDYLYKLQPCGRTGEFSYYCKGVQNGCTAAGTVWGSNPYTFDSNMCLAALHSGKISIEGGNFEIQDLGFLDNYIGSTQNNVDTQNYGKYKGIQIKIN